MRENRARNGRAGRAGRLFISKFKAADIADVTRTVYELLERDGIVMDDQSRRKVNALLDQQEVQEIQAPQEGPGLA